MHGQNHIKFIDKEVVVTWF